MRRASGAGVWMTAMGKPAAFAFVLVGACTFKGAPGGNPSDGGVADADPDADIDGSVSERGMRVDCSPLPPPPPGSLIVTNVTELEEAVSSAGEGTTILVADGSYVLTEKMVIRTPGLTIRSMSGVPDQVVLISYDPDGPEAIKIEDDDATFAELTVRNGRTGIKVEPSGEETATTAVLHRLNIEGFTRRGIDGREATTGGRLSCSRLESAVTCLDFVIGVDISEAVDEWRVTENTLISRCDPSGTHSGVRVGRRARFATIDHNRISGFRTGFETGIAPFDFSCDGQDGVGWDTYSPLFCSNAVVLPNVSNATGISMGDACEGDVLFNSIASDGANVTGVDLTDSKVDIVNNAFAGAFQSSDSSGLDEPNRMDLVTSDFVAFPNDLRLNSDEAGSLAGVFNVPRIEDFCSWGLGGGERDLDNPGFGAFAPSP